MSKFLLPTGRRLSLDVGDLNVKAQVAVCGNVPGGTLQHPGSKLTGTKSNYFGNSKAESPCCPLLCFRTLSTRGRAVWL